MSRGRGRSRVRFGGSRDSALADVLDETREDLGLSHSQMEQLHADAGAALFPPLELPQPEALADEDAYLIRRQRLLAHRLEALYQPWDADPTGPSKASAPSALVHVTLPEAAGGAQDKGNRDVFVPEELQANSLSGGRASGGLALQQRGIMQPRAFESVFKSLEAQEQKGKGKDAAGANADEMELEEENDEDLGDDMNDYTFDYYDSDAGSDDGDEEVFF